VCVADKIFIISAAAAQPAAGDGVVDDAEDDCQFHLSLRRFFHRAGATTVEATVTGDCLYAQLDMSC